MSACYLHIMRLWVNGQDRDLADGLTVSELLDLDGEPVSHVIVEINGVFLPRSRYAVQGLREGDRVEIILPAFGG